MAIGDAANEAVTDETTRRVKSLPLLAVMALLLSACDPATGSLPLSAADCATTFWCLDKGRCKAKGDNCIAVSEDDCKKSTECKTKKRCLLVGEFCGTSPFGDCADSDLCKKNGYCRTVGELCCKSDGWCCDVDGNCSNR